MQKISKKNRLFSSHRAQTRRKQKHNPGQTKRSPFFQTPGKKLASSLHFIIREFPLYFVRELGRREPQNENAVVRGIVDIRFCCIKLANMNRPKVNTTDQQHFIYLDK